MSYCSKEILVIIIEIDIHWTHKCSLISQLLTPTHLLSAIYTGLWLQQSPCPLWGGRLSLGLGHQRCENIYYY